MDIVDDIRSSRWPHWKGAGIWLIYAVIGGSASLWGSMIILGDPSVGSYIARGDFYIYAVAILSPCLFVIHDLYRVNLWSGLTFVLIIACVFLFSATMPRSAATTQSIYSAGFLQVTSWAAFAFAIGLTFITRLVENVSKVAAPNLIKKRHQEVQDLRRDFDALGGE